MNKYLLDTKSTTERKIIDLTKYGLSNALILGKYKYNYAHEQLSDHLHKGIMEICYCHKGHQVYEVNDKIYNIKGGDVFVTFPDEIHSTGAHPEEKGVLYWLLIKIPANRQFFHYSKDDGITFINTLLNLPQRHFKGSLKIKQILESIIEVSEKADVMQRLILENLIISFLIQVCTDANAQMDAPLRSGNAAKIERFINDHYKEPLSIETMAEMLHISESRFKSWFKEEFGIPPLEFILRKRINEAKIMMQSKPDLNMSVIAYDLGFCSPQHFATTFKRYTFLSPKKFKDSSAFKI